MPAILTHDFFGKDAFEIAAGRLGFATMEEQEAFLLGNQGPDPLFFLQVDPLLHRWATMGSLMHKARTSELLLSMRDAIAPLPLKDVAVARAYIAGFLCHYLLDTTTHPFIFFLQDNLTSMGVEGLDKKAAPVVHAEIERDLDEAILYARTGKTVKTYRPYSETLRASLRTLYVLDRVYFYVLLWTYDQPTDTRIFSSAVVDNRMMQHLAYSPSGKKIKVLSHMERTFGTQRYSLLEAISHRPRASADSDFDNRLGTMWIDPATGEKRYESFWSLYDAALANVPYALDTFFSHDFDLEAAQNLTHGLNFDGKPSLEDGPRLLNR